MKKLLILAFGLILALTPKVASATCNHSSDFMCPDGWNFLTENSSIDTGTLDENGNELYGAYISSPYGGGSGRGILILQGVSSDIYLKLYSVPFNAPGTCHGNPNQTSNWPQCSYNTLLWSIKGASTSAPHTFHFDASGNLEIVGAAGTRSWYNNLDCSTHGGSWRMWVGRDPEQVQQDCNDGTIIWQKP